MKTDRLIELRNEQDKRDREFLKVYAPSPSQEPIHRSAASELLVRGGKRSGKSVSVSAEFAARVTGRNIVSASGEIIKTQWPNHIPNKDYPRIFWIIGWDTKHIGQTIHRLLFRPGQGGSFRVIQDLKTGLWRTWNRADPEDAKRVAESKLSEPLIPERYWDGDENTAFEWEDKKAYQFNSLKLKNGATIYAYPSSSRNPKQGDAVSGIWVDEDIQFPGHLKEWQDRLTDEEGWFMWSVWPHMKNESLIDLLSRAEMAELDDKPQIQSFQLIMTENPYLSDKGKSESIGRMQTDEEVARRNRGELLADSLVMYQFSNAINTIQRPLKGRMQNFQQSKAQALITDIYLQSNGFPREWTRYLSMDPSNTRTACHSWVVPPLEWQGVYLGNVAIAEWELVARRFSAQLLAKTLAELMGTKNYEAFIMDQQAGRQTHAGREDNTFQLYASAFREAGIISRQTNSSFLPGCNVRATRFNAVRQLLSQQNNGLAGMLIVEEKNLETIREFAKYRKKTEARGEGIDSVLDEPANPRLFDCMASVEYFAAYIENMFTMGQAYVDPVNYVSRGSEAYKRAKKMLDKKDETSKGVVYLGSDRYSGQLS
jgi:hypothetical protein